MSGIDPSADTDPMKLGFHVTACVYDGPFLAIAYSIKMIRLLAVLGVLAIMERVYLSRYFDATYMSTDPGPPPNLTAVPLIVFGVEALLFAIAFTILFVFEAALKTESNAYVVDTGLLVSLAVDFFLTTCASCVIASGIMSTIASCSLRYKTDGMRGIRAGFRLVQISCCVIFMLPAFLLAT